MPKHISQVTSKRAEDLAHEELEPDTYHQDIWKGSRALLDRGLGDYTYLSQWSGGTTLWVSPDRSETVKVQRGRVA